jgi:hypothetical protein
MLIRKENSEIHMYLLKTRQISRDDLQKLLAFSDNIAFNMTNHASYRKGSGL